MLILFILKKSFVLHFNDFIETNFCFWINFNNLKFKYKQK